MITFSRIQSESNPFYSVAFARCADSFPIHEQRLRESQQQILTHPQYHCCAVLENGSFCGILFYWEIGKISYIEHFAVSFDQRGKGIGSQILKTFLKEHPLTVLEIDPPCDSVSIRRKGFYERLRFAENLQEHFHPSYRPGVSPHALRVMSFPRTISKEEYEVFFTYLKDTVMNKAY